MLDNISLIASVISALTAVTTSLRALGKSRENARHEIEAKIKSSCRIGGSASPEQITKNSGVLLHLAVTIIWFLLSIIFSLPLLSRKFSEGGVTGLFPWIFPFTLVAVVNGLIWWRTLHMKN